jgi:hypothetical protein
MGQAVRMFSPAAAKLTDLFKAYGGQKHLTNHPNNAKIIYGNVRLFFGNFISG